MNDPRDTSQPGAPAPDAERRAERYVSSLLQGLPARSAPAHLVERVMERAARERRAWWLAGYANWPPLARLLFLPLAIGTTALAMLVSARLWPAWSDVATTAPARSLAGVGHGLMACADAAQSAAAAVMGRLPAGAASVVVVVLLAAYAMLFGIGAAAFRTLYAPNRAN